ncbi:uncharacterized protein N7473_001246 [Penicillium subrubescens]|uniref:uncharacterized protein n=1 Tax=Penicillium subrubescens TaxID=1316194 RepID=UPI002544D673|nr:uncharacterized protein N7473_001246 [Penicillium subrubescens]KAJ5911943.1 hypothetical protein N7473_001246 [Penicillium subrubescens]
MEENPGDQRSSRVGRLPRWQCPLPSSNYLINQASAHFLSAVNTLHSSRYQHHVFSLNSRHHPFNGRRTSNRGGASDYALYLQ